MEEDIFTATMAKHSKLIFQMYRELENILHEQIGTLGLDINSTQSDTIRLIMRTHIRIRYLSERQPLYNALFDLGFADRESMLTFFTADFLRYFENKLRENM
ncbi:MAG: hypothetical protein EOM52_01250 [Clostridia bacterium]|nr:hypothetical protein [Clostridia bacterium]